METKQYATKKTSGSTMKLKNTLTQMPMKTQPYKNLWDTAKAVLRGKFIVIQAFFKKQEKSEINNLTHHLKEFKKEK